LRVAATFGRETRRLLSVRSVGLILTIDEAFERETVTQGETDVRRCARSSGATPRR
jgi:hypothetical protein